MYYITTSRPYANAELHLGHAMDATYADCFRRFWQLMKPGEVHWSAGLDEHGLKIQETAQKQGKTPREFVDERYEQFCAKFSKLDWQPDIIDRTSVPFHYWFVNLVWNKLYQKGLIYKKEYQGLYCSGCEDFYSESQLVDGKCPIHPYLEIQKVTEENYFYKLSNFKEPLQEFLKEVQIPDSRISKEMLNIVEDLKDISISRPKSRVSWGIPVEMDKEQTVYVWFEALLTYLSCLVSLDYYENWLEADQDIRKAIEQEVWSLLAELLPIDLMIMGEDNAKFHLIILPAILLGLDLPLPKAALIHGMITDHLGRKFSKSLGNGVLLEEFYQKVGKEGVRFFILHECNSIGNTSFDWQQIENNYNANLANNLGNLVVRVTNLIEKHLDGYIDLEKFPINVMNMDNFADWDLKLDLQRVYQHLYQLRPELGFRSLMEEVTKINQYLEQQKPWTLAQNLPENLEQIRHILEVSAFWLKEVGKVLALFLPESAEKIVRIFEDARITKAPILFERLELTK